MNIVTTFGKVLRDMFAPKVTVYEWSNMSDKEKTNFKKQFKAMRKVARDVEDEMDKMWDLL